MPRDGEEKDLGKKACVFDTASAPRNSPLYPRAEGRFRTTPDLVHLSHTNPNKQKASTQCFIFAGALRYLNNSSEKGIKTGLHESFVMLIY